MPPKTPPSSIIAKLSEHERTLFLLLTVIAGIIILWPLHNFQYYLAQGDHGRDLYCFKKTMEGAVPYRDYSWLFGPLMPYYYSLCYLLGGVNIQSVLLGQGVLILLTGVLIYAACSVFLSSPVSFICALWYWDFRGAEFFYTYNHSGGLLALIAALYCLFKYIRDNRLRHVTIGFLSIFLLTLIRLNMGVAVLIAFTLSLFLADIIHKDPEASKKRRYYVFLSLAVLTATSAIHWLLLYSLPDYAIYQSFPYGKSQRTDYTATPLSALLFSAKTIVSYFTAALAQKIFGALLFLCAVQSVILIFSDKLPQKLKENFICVFGSLFIFIVLCAHEFIASGVFYRMFWVMPLVYVAVFFLIAFVAENLPSLIIRILIFITLILPPLWNIPFDRRVIQSYKQPAHMLNIGQNKIYTTQHPRWFKTVVDTTEFIKKNIPSSDTILVLPLDPLYLFLSERNSAARQLVFFEHIHIPKEQEEQTISEMENGNGNWAVLSSRSQSPEPGMGTFGETYCPLLAQYLSDHFIEVAEFGDWESPPGWAWNHGVRIYRRVNGLDGI